MRKLWPYRLPDGTVARVDDSVAKGARFISHTMKGGKVVLAYRMLSREELIRRIEGTKFECEGGYLIMNQDWIDLKQSL